MSHQRKIVFLVIACLCVSLCASAIPAQDEGEYSTLMQQADRFLVESKIEEARTCFAEALQHARDDTEKTHAALFLVMTFEKEGLFQEPECRAWIAGKLEGKEIKVWGERGIREYRRKFLGETSIERKTAYALRSPTPMSQPSDLKEEVRSIAYTELMRRGEELNYQGRHVEARMVFAKALVSEPKKDGLSRAAMGIAKSFPGERSVEVDTCKTWVEANIPNAEDRLRVAIAIGEYYYRKHDYEAAIVQLESVVKQKGTLADVGSLIVALSLLGEGKRDAALTTFKQVAARSSSDEIAAKAMFLIGWTHLQEQEYASARKAFEKVSSKYPKSKFSKKATELSERLKSFEKQNPADDQQP